MGPQTGPHVRRSYDGGMQSRLVTYTIGQHLIVAGDLLALCRREELA